MAQYIVVHIPVAEAATQQALFQIFHEVATRAAENTEWLGSWITTDGSQMLCLWSAPDEGSIRAALPARSLEMAPIETVYEVVPIHPEDFR